MSMDLEVLMRFAIGFLIGACLWAAGNRVHAQPIPATPTTQTQPATQANVVKYTVNGYQATIGWVASPDALMSAYISYRNGLNAICSTNGSGAARESNTSGTLNAGYFTVLQTCGPYPDGTYQWQNMPVNVNYIQQNFNEYQCLSGWTLDGTNCTLTTYSCPTGYTLSGTTCNQNVAPAGEEGPQMCIPASASPGAGACYNGTLYDYRSASNQFAIDGVQQWCGPTQSSGQPCAASTPQGATGSPSACPAGKVPGLINGQTVCLGAGDNNPAVSVETQKQTTTNSQGQSTTSTTTSTTTDRGGSGATRTTTTTNPDGSSTTTTSSTNPGATKTEMQRFCDQNPETTICRRSTWGGACGAFACDGDAVQCAIAREMHQRNCQLFETSSALSELGNAIAAGNDPQASQNPALEANRQTTSLTGSISQETFLGQGGLADQQIVVSPSLTVTLPWSQLNQYLSYMGAIVVAFALVFAARLVVGAR